jgi:hypothetical protein
MGCPVRELPCQIIQGVPKKVRNANKSMAVLVFRNFPFTEYGMIGITFLGLPGIKVAIDSMIFPRSSSNLLARLVTIEKNNRIRLLKKNHIRSSLGTCECHEAL